MVALSLVQDQLFARPPEEHFPDFLTLRAAAFGSTESDSTVHRFCEVGRAARGCVRLHLRQVVGLRSPTRGGRHRAIAEAWLARRSETC